AGHLTGWSDGSARLFFAFHHLIIDAVSWRIIADDMRLLLTGHTLPAKTSSYRQWVAAMQAYAGTHQDEVTYWQQVIEDKADHYAQGEANHHHVRLSVEQTQTLLYEANAGYHTEINDLLLSALTIALQNTFNQSTNHITLEGHGREAIDETLDLSQTVGWFTTIYPVRLESQSTVSDTIVYTKEMLRKVPNKGVGYGALRQAGDVSGCSPVISFNYLGQLGAEMTPQDWMFTADDCGLMMASENADPLLLNINGGVQAGQLGFS
uniref:condensation domain-containing protein n=1 Tax=Xenorhabdus vietnamensis TaxID=351656 RepID=UPI001FCA17DD